MTPEVKRILVLAALGLLWAVPLALVYFGFRRRRIWREVRQGKSALVSPITTSTDSAAVSTVYRRFDIKPRAIAIVYAFYALMMSLIILGVGQAWTLVLHALYVLLLLITWWSIFSPGQYRSEHMRDPSLARGTYIATMAGIFGIMPLAAWMAIGWPMLRITLRTMRAH